MQTAKSNLLVVCLKTFDIVIMLVALAISLTLYEGSQGHEIEILTLFQLKVKLINVLLLAVFALVWHGVFVSVGLYDSRRLEGSKGEWYDIFKAVLMGSMLLLAVAVIFHRSHI